MSQALLFLQHETIRNSTSAMGADILCFIFLLQIMKPVEFSVQ
jgi:hypothetical protein